MPIRLRYNPTWFPEIDHWKMTIFVGQNLVAFGSANYTPFELAPASSTNYKDETVLLTDDPALVNAFKTQVRSVLERHHARAESLVGATAVLQELERRLRPRTTGAAPTIATRYPNPAPMIINTARLEPDYPLPPDMIWGQGSTFNNRLVQEINNETDARRSS